MSSPAVLSTTVSINNLNHNEFIYFFLNFNIRVVCPNFEHPVLTFSFMVYAICRFCRHATKIINHHSKAETISKLTVRCKTIFHLQKFRATTLCNFTVQHNITLITTSFLLYGSNKVICYSTVNIHFLYIT